MIFHAAIFFILITGLVYNSFLPLIATILFFFPFHFILKLITGRRSPEVLIFRRMFSAGCIAIGISSVFLIVLGDAEQSSGVPGVFFDSIAESKYKGWSLEMFSGVSTGGIVILIWQAVTDLFEGLGFPRERYVGLMVNNIFVSFACVVGVKIVRLVYGEGWERLRVFIRVMPLCGIFWLFSGIYMRDSFGLLLIAILLFGWTWYVSRSTWFRDSYRVILLSVILAPLLFYTRWEWALLPVAAGLAASASIYIGGEASRLPGKASALIFIVSGIIIFIYFGGFAVLETGYLNYKTLVDWESDPNSLGRSLIVDQNIFVRGVFGILYLFYQPIPFWAGFLTDSAYHWFKSWNAIFSYFLSPMLLLSIKELSKTNIRLDRRVSFLIFFSVGVGFASAVSSLESRHFGPLYIPIGVLAMAWVGRSRRWREDYLKLLGAVLCVVFLVHITWFFLKFGG